MHDIIIHFMCHALSYCVSGMKNKDVQSINDIS